MDRYRWRDRDLDDVVIPTLGKYRRILDALPEIGQKLGRQITTGALKWLFESERSRRGGDGRACDYVIGGRFWQELAGNTPLVPRSNPPTIDNSVPASNPRYAAAEAPTLPRQAVGTPSRDVDASVDYPASRPAMPPPAMEGFGARHVAATIAPDVRRLLDAVQGRPVNLEVLCNKLDMSPEKTARLVERARSDGYAIVVEHDHVGFALPEPTGDIVDLGIAPVVGQRQMVGVAGDIHFGSKFCMRSQLKDFVDYAYGIGVREIYGPGDMLQGHDPKWIFDCSHVGIEAQCGDAFENLPARPGLTWHWISGNHDDKYADAIGMAPGDYIESFFQRRGRSDVRFYGRRGGYVKERGATIEMWHPKKCGSYALSYHLQNHIRDYAVGQKPDILLAGHWHIFCYLEQRGVHAIATPTFQGARGTAREKGAFGTSLGGAPSIGGLIVSWDVTETRTLRRVSVERVSYYEKEELRELALA